MLERLSARSLAANSRMKIQNSFSKTGHRTRVTPGCLRSMQIVISHYNHIVVLTGAGLSAASGLRTYRGPGGIWEENNVQEYGHVQALWDQSERTWQLFGGMREPLRSAKPNAAHLALAHLENSLHRGQQFLLVTQNVDGLHQQAGSQNIVELHGNVGLTRCTNEDCDLQPFPDEQTYSDHLPKCPKCSNLLRPHVVLFGEAIPPLASWQSKRALRDCDLFIAIGTSGSVSPASNFVRSAEYAGARTIYINLEPMSPKNPAFKEEYLGKAEEILPTLLGVDL